MSIRLHTPGRCTGVQGLAGGAGRCTRCTRSRGRGGKMHPMYKVPKEGREDAPGVQGLAGGAGPCTVYGVKMAICVQGPHPIVRPCTRAGKRTRYPWHDGVPDTGFRAGNALTWTPLTGNASTGAHPRDTAQPFAWHRRPCAVCSNYLLGSIPFRQKR